MKKILLVVGAGGHGIVVADAAELSRRWSQIMFADDKYPAMRAVAKWEIVGLASEPMTYREIADEIVVAVGDNVRRLSLLQAFIRSGFSPAVIVHPSASVSTLATLEGGTVILGNAVVSARARLDLGCIINSGATVDHDCVLEEAVHVSPGAHLAADVLVGKRSWIGIGAVVRNQVRIGCDVIVGAGAAVVKDVPDNLTVVGVPARASK